MMRLCAGKITRHRAGSSADRGYGCAGMSALASGLVTMELHRGDGSLGVALGVHSGLAIRSIALCVSDEQKQRWLPAMARMELLGAFALTEPDHGSDSLTRRDPRHRRRGSGSGHDGHAAPCCDPRHRRRGSGLPPFAGGCRGLPGHTLDPLRGRQAPRAADAEVRWYGDPAFGCGWRSPTCW